MFYSRLLLSNKGSLGFVWIAAHCPKRLKRDQVSKTDISSSVGVVRIYSMKVEYLFHDCNEALNRLCEFNMGKRTRPSIGVSRTNYHSITVPKKFELDEFDLEILEDRDIMGGTTGSGKDVVLADEQIKMGDALGLLYKENVSFPETHSVAYTPPRDVLLPPHMDHDNDLLMNSSRDNGDFVASVEKLRGTDFLFEDWQSPTELNGSEKDLMHHRLHSEYPRIGLHWLSHETKCDSVASSSHYRSDIVPCMEILQENGFSLEDRLDPLVLDEAEERQICCRSHNEDLTINFPASIQYSECSMLARPSHKKQGIEEEHVEHPTIELNLHKDEPCALIRSIDIGQSVEAEKKKFVEVITPEIRKSQRNQEHTKPMTVDMTPNSKRSGIVPCMEILQEDRFSLEDRLDPLVLDESEEQQIHFRSYNEDLRTNFREPIQYSECAMIASPAHEKHGIEEERVEHPRIMFHEDEPSALIGLIDIGQAEKKKFVEVISPEIIKYRINHQHMKPMTVDVIPNSKRPGVGTPEIATVHTPAPKEHVKMLKKRKILLDLTTALPSKVLKSWIDDSNDIVHKRRKVPHTLLRAWRANKLCHITQCFLDPLIHSIPIEHGSIHHKKDTYTAPIADVVSEDYVNSTIMIGIQEQIQDETSPLTPMSCEQTPIQDERSPLTPMSHEQTLIAPGTPIAHFNSLRSHENRAVADSDILEPTSPHESFEQQPLEFIIAFPDEEMNSYEGDYLENNVYSARTRAVGIFLYKNFLYKKSLEEEDEVLNLTHLLRGKAKEDSARLFYEILVLKTGECIDVSQDKAYDDIMLQEVPPKLKQIAETNEL
ncbi:sister chromatid cohesion 1 protein 2-like isoform X2 [Henckelia pumila]|uniref:sister chromatid cohesion 1 protein 2-like isoform X2 n=1 Tax=Henckelia pumila TaxID=405737 RepID=UPI003C6E8385